MRILIVEDNPVNQKIAKFTVERAGFECDTVWNGLEAVDACKRVKYDLILMDWQMPEMDGLEATRQIRQLGDPQPMILAITAYSQAAAFRECSKSGVDLCIGKPYSTEQLITLLQKLLRSV